MDRHELKTAAFAALCGVKKDTLLHYDRIGLLKPSRVGENGYRYYDFTYIGTWGTEYEKVPTIIQNYLLYELAFYRAGFFWGVYYDHTCDARHFGLGEYDPAVHSDSPLALRKVFEYIDE